MTQTRSPRLSGYFLFETGPMLSGALYKTMSLEQLITQMSESQQRLFACDCAERVLPFYEEQNPSDSRPRYALETARRFAQGYATISEVDRALAALVTQQQISEYDDFALTPADDTGQLAWKAAVRAVLAAWFPDIRVRSTTLASERAAKQAPQEQVWQRERAIFYLTGNA